MIDDPWGFNSFDPHSPWGLSNPIDPFNPMNNRMGIISQNPTDPFNPMNSGMGVIGQNPIDPFGAGMNPGIPMQNVMPSPMNTNPSPEPLIPPVDSGINPSGDVQGVVSHDNFQSGANAPFEKPFLPPESHLIATDGTMEIPESNAGIHHPDNFGSDDEAIGHEEKGSERMWSDRDYPFYPKPRGGKVKGAGKKMRIPALKARRKKPIIYGMEKCPECGIYWPSGFCELCRMQYLCMACREPLHNGECKNPLCLLHKDDYCPECGEKLPCKCGFGR